MEVRPDLMKLGRHDGKGIIVTGAGAGIGQQAAFRLAAEGASVVCLDFNEETAAATAGTITARGGVAWPVTCDIAVEEQVRAAFDAALALAGRLDVLVANAGVAGPVGPIVDLDVSAWLRILAVNVTGQLLCAKHALRHMTQAQAGVIVFTASHASFAAVPGWTPYAATKGAVLSLTRGLAVDHAPDGVRVNCVCPGPIETRLMLDGYEDIVRTASQQDGSRRGRVGSPTEVAGLISFLASDDATLVNGASLVADAGALAHMGTSWPSPAYWD